MSDSINTRPFWMIWLGGVALTAWTICCSPMPAQDFLVAAQGRSAGESADDDPEDTGERGAADAREDAAQREAETLTPAERAAALKRRAGEQVGGRPRGRANVLGMSIQEGSRGQVHVVDVAPASPAFDAGVRKGDAIIDFDGFHGESYRDWIDGMQRMARDTPDGAMMSVELLRGGKRFGTQIRAPEARADDPRVPQLLGPLQGPHLLQGNQATQDQGGPPTVPQPSQPIAAGSGGNVFIDNSPFDAAFDAGGANVNDRAVAQIFRLNPQQQTAISNSSGNTVAPEVEAQPAADASATQSAQQATRATSPQLQPTGAQASGAGRIGIAGFRNDAEGLLVMVDIASLEPGSYRVGIDDPAIVVGGGQSTADAGTTGAVTTPGTAVTTPGTNVPPSGLDRPLTTPPSGLDRPLSTPPSGQDRPLTSTPTGLPETRQQDQSNTALAGQAPPETSQNGTLSHIGVLTIDQSGTGQMQQLVEGVQVADVAGQAIVIYAPVKPPQTAIPPNPNVSGIRDGAGDPNVPAQQATPAQREVPQQTPRMVPGGEQPAGTMQPIAAGMIQLLSDRRPGQTAAAPQEASSDDTQVQGASDSEPVERAALPQQQQVR